MLSKLEMAEIIYDELVNANVGGRVYINPSKGRTYFLPNAKSSFAPWDQGEEVISVWEYLTPEAEEVILTNDLRDWEPEEAINWLKDNLSVI
ncbi:MAG: hypothetical protein CV045_02885 [Cyanobacteria bacterium M5B4]|nr:MAG: hypothetical protein CV045_02885 [Cyanobacteria bacterium M5B4]